MPRIAAWQSRRGNTLTKRALGKAPIRRDPASRNPKGESSGRERIKLKFPSPVSIPPVSILIGSSKETLGGAMGIRTPDLLNAIEALYQLSYDPKRCIKGTKTGSLVEVGR